MDTGEDTKIKKLAQAIQSGDETAYQELFELYFERIYRFLLTILKNPDDAEDVTSVVFIYVWNNRAALRQPEQIVSWLYQIAKHRAFDLLRKSKKASLPLDILVEQLPDEGALSPERKLDNYFISEAVAELLDSLSPEERSVIHLRFAEDLDYNSIGERLGQSSVYIRVKLHRAVKKLQKQMDADQSEFYGSEKAFTIANE